MKAQMIGPVQPSAEDMRVARCAADKLAKAGTRDTPRLRIGDGGNIELPASAMAILADVLEHFAEGRAVVLATREFEVSTQRAADILNVSRPYLVELLESGKIPFRRVGTHRRIRLDDVLAYQTEMRARTARALDELTALSEEMGLYG
jgi:excisionase family DNA binding protein